MRRLRRMLGRRGITPVVATIILSAFVIAIGGAVWNYAQGATTIIAEDYINGTMSLLNEVIERFTVEHVSNNSEGSVLYVWIYNHGDVDIIIDVYANATHDATYYFSSKLGTCVVTGGLMKIEVSFQSTPLQPGDEVAIKAHSRRQNNAYYKYCTH